MKPETVLAELVDEPLEDAPELPSCVAPPGGLAITEVERTAARRALKKAGLTTIKLDRVEAQSEFGQYVARLGVFNLAAAEYVVTAQQLAKAIETTVTLDAQLQNPEARVALMQSREKMLKTSVELVSIAFKAGAAEMQSQTQNNPNQMPFPPNTPIQNNYFAPVQIAEVKS